jgi:hypothetical protein
MLANIVVVLQGMMPQKFGQTILFSLISLGHRAFAHRAINQDEQRHAHRCNHTLQNVVHG